MRLDPAPLSRIFARGHASRRRIQIQGAPSLDHFLQRSRALSLYRSILRGTRRIADARTRAETRSHVRDEFERHRNVHDIPHIRYLLSTGKAQWESMERYIGGMR